MEMLCPECLAPLVSTDGRTARCTTHGGEFRILFARDVPKTANVSGPQLAGAMPPTLDAAAGPRFPGMRCVQHPESDATQQCQACGAYMCATCDFMLPGGVHLCPACATKPQTALSPKRKRAMIWSYVLAGGGTLGFVVTMGAAQTVRTEAGQNALGMLMMLVVLLPSIVGLGLGLGHIDRRLANPASLWGATIWNGIVLGIFILLCIIGNMQ